jgi:hypothetical protein
MFIEGKINPYWDINYFKKLKYVENPDPIVSHEYCQVGHSREPLTILHCTEPNFLNFDRTNILENFKNLENIALAVNLFKPGQYIPLHVDRYERYRQLYTGKTVVRIIFMLEDSVPGQIIQINDKTIGTWKSGDWFGWHDQDSHAFYNMSKVDRYALQLTATTD